MHDGPSGDVLLGIARQALLTEILPLLGPAHRYTGLMIANAMAIAAREMAADTEAAAAAERRLVEAAYAALPAPPPAEDRNRALAADIRAGRFDSAAHAELAALFRHQIAARLSLSNPKYPA